MKIVGFRHYDFVDKKTNKQFKGLSLYYNDQLADQNETSFGMESGKISIGEQYIANVMGTLEPKALVGKNVKLEYNKYGNIDKLIVVG